MTTPLTPARLAEAKDTHPVLRFTLFREPATRPRGVLAWRATPESEWSWRHDVSRGVNRPMPEATDLCEVQPALLAGRAAAKGVG